MFYYGITEVITDPKDRQPVKIYSTIPRKFMITLNPLLELKAQLVSMVSPLVGTLLVI